MSLSGSSLALDATNSIVAHPDCRTLGEVLTAARLEPMFVPFMLIVQRGSTLQGFTIAGPLMSMQP